MRKSSLATLAPLTFGMLATWPHITLADTDHQAREQTAAEPTTPASSPPAIVRSNPTDGTAATQSCCATRAQLLDLRAEVLDHHRRLLDWALTATALWLALLGLGVPALGFVVGRHFYKRFREEARDAARIAGEAADKAKTARLDAAKSSNEANETLGRIRKAAANVDEIRDAAIEARDAARGATREAARNKAELAELQKNADRHFKQIADIAKRGVGQS